MALSGLCVAHCLALPLLVVALPFLGIFTQNDIVHKVLVLIAAPLSGLALWQSGGWRKRDVTVLMGLGLILLATAAFLPSLDAYEAVLSVVGALLVAGAHAVNYGLVRLFHRHVNGSACDL